MYIALFEQGAPKISKTAGERILNYGKELSLMRSVDRSIVVLQVKKTEKVRPPESTKKEEEKEERSKEKKEQEKREIGGK